MGNRFTGSQTKQINVLLLLKDSGQGFVFLWDTESGPEFYRTLGKFASDPDLDFSWYDAAWLSQQARSLERQAGV